MADQAQVQQQCGIQKWRSNSENVFARNNVRDTEKRKFHRRVAIGSMLAALGRAQTMVALQCSPIAKAALLRCSLNKAGLQVSPESEGMALGDTDDGDALKPTGVVMTKEWQTDSPGASNKTGRCDNTKTLCVWTGKLDKTIGLE